MITKAIIVIVLFVEVLSLLGCDAGKKKDEPATQKVAVVSRKLDILNVDISSATRSSIAIALNDEESIFVRKINKWEEIWSVGPAFKDAVQIKLGFTEAGALAYYQLNYAVIENENIASKIQGKIETQYGKPSRINGDVTSGEYEAVWDTGDGLSISVSRDWPTKYINLTYYNDSAYDTLALEYRIDTGKSMYKNRIF